MGKDGSWTFVKRTFWTTYIKEKVKGKRGNNSISGKIIAHNPLEYIILSIYYYMYTKIAKRWDYLERYVVPIIALVGDLSPFTLVPPHFAA